MSLETRTRKDGWTHKLPEKKLFKHFYRNALQTNYILLLKKFSLCVWKVVGSILTRPLSLSLSEIPVGLGG